VGTRDLRTLWSPSVTLNQERHTKAQSSFLFFYFYFLNLLFLKSPPWNLLLADLIIFFLNSLSPQGSVLFTIPSSKQPLPSGAKQATYTTHSWNFRPCHAALPAKHTQLSYARLCHSRGGCRAGPGRPFVTDPARHPPRRATDRPGVPSWAWSAWWTRAPSQTDVVNLCIWLSCQFKAKAQGNLGEFGNNFYLRDGRRMFCGMGTTWLPRIEQVGPL